MAANNSSGLNLPQNLLVSNMSMYAKYVKEFMDDEIIENDTGFVHYRYLNENQVYIINIWTDPVFRKRGEAAFLADAVVYEAKIRGCRELLGTVVLSAKNVETSIRVLLAYGMKVKSSSSEMITFTKEI